MLGRWDSSKPVASEALRGPLSTTESDTLRENLRGHHSQHFLRKRAFAEMAHKALVKKTRGY
jgi:hypothetical protein